MKTGIKIVSAKHVYGYKIEIKFSDGKVNTFDYKSLVTLEHECFKPYSDLNKFRKFKIINGHTSIAWGDDWNMILPIHTLYSKSKTYFGGNKQYA